MTDDAKQLLLRCFEGDKASWDRFVQDYAGLIYHTIKKTLALHRGSTPADSAEDIFQDTFLSLIKDDFAQLRRFRGDNGCTLASWLRMIAARRTIDHLRKSNKPANPLEESVFDGLADESENEGSNEQLQLLASVLPEIQPRERIIIDLFFRQNLSAPDVASILHLPVGAVYTQKSRILAKLREALQKSGPL
jgi:RNA polymerase sigma-70 factor (ECF subfamily)